MMEVLIPAITFVLGFLLAILSVEWWGAREGGEGGGEEEIPPPSLSASPRYKVYTKKFRVETDDSAKASQAIYEARRLGIPYTFIRDGEEV